MPATSGASGPTTTKSTLFALQNATTAAWSEMSRATHSASCAMPALPGAQQSFVASGARGDLPGQRVLAPARAEEEDVHGRLM